LGYRLQPLQKRTLAQEAFEELLAYVQDGTLRPGDALPSQQELARQLSVSRPVLREAMQRLVAAGLIEIRHGSGCFVARSQLKTALGPLFETFTHERAVEVLELRMIVEVEMAALAATRATADDFARMEAALESVRHLHARGELTVQGSAEFHRALGQASHNSLLAAIAQLLHQPNYLEALRVQLALPDVPAHDYEDHRELLGVIRRGDPERARSAARRHIEIAHGWEQQIAALRREIRDARRGAADGLATAVQGAATR
jgi:GntR family transcriptional repressor for pyruvate dehydrogenase complex